MVKTRQKSLEGNRVMEHSDFADFTCGQCSRKYKRAKWWKCDHKPIGWGYDIRLKHPACKNFKLKEGSP